jgi:hypothetical protein
MMRGSAAWCWNSERKLALHRGRQQVNHRAEAQAVGALRHRGEEQAGRGGAAERRRMVLGQMIAVEPGAIVGLDEAEPVGIETVRVVRRIVHVVEHAELHRVGTVPVASARD